MHDSNVSLIFFSCWLWWAGRVPGSVGEFFEVFVGARTSVAPIHIPEKRLVDVVFSDSVSLNGGMAAVASRHNPIDLHQVGVHGGLMYTVKTPF